MNILIVDDEPRHLSGMCRMLRRMRPGWRIETAESAEDALKKISADPPDLLLTDIRMEQMDGLSLIAALRGRYPDMRIVVVSAYDSFEYAKRAIRMSVTDYLLKPIDEGEFGELLKRLGLPGEADTVLAGNEGETLGYGPGNEIVYKAMEYIELHYGEEISLYHIAAHFHFTPAYLSTMFKKETGVGFTQYLKDVRLSKSKKILRGSNLKVRDIALKIGYKDPGYFIRVFRQEYGVTPDEYRRRAGSEL